MADQEKDKTPAATASTETPAAPVPAKASTVTEEVSSQYFFGEPLVGFDPGEITGSLIVIEGMDGSGRSTQIALLQEWLESEGFAVQTSGLRRSNLVGRDIDELLAKNAVTRLTLALMYATDFYDQLEHRIIPALRSDFVVLADRYFYTLIARGSARGIQRDYLHGLYEMALRPDLTFWLNVRPEVAFEREFRKSHAIIYCESGRDLSLSNDLFQSFIMYQAKIRKEFEALAERHGFLAMDGEASVATVNAELRKRIAAHLGIPQLATGDVLRPPISMISAPSLTIVRAFFTISPSFMNEPGKKDSGLQFMTPIILIGAGFPIRSLFTLHWDISVQLLQKKYFPSVKRWSSARYPPGPG
jgi:dTMP kinase